MSHRFALYYVLFFCILGKLSSAIPYNAKSDQSSLNRRTESPYFPQQPPSCPICQQNYASINSCAEAAPVLANFSQVIFNPGAFVDTIKCACTDTFTSTYPQCVDCFEQTNQTSLLNTQDASAVVDGMRKICAIASTLLGGVATADGEATPTSSTYVPKSTASTSKGTRSSPISHHFVPHLLCAFGLFGNWAGFV